MIKKLYYFGHSKTFGQDPSLIIYIYIYIYIVIDTFCRTGNKF